MRPPHVLAPATAALMAPFTQVVPASKEVNLICVQVELVGRPLEQERLARYAIKMATEKGPRGRLASPGTILNHVGAVGQMMRHMAPKDTLDITERDLRDYFESRDADKRRGPKDPAKTWLDPATQGLGLIASRTIRYHKLYIRRFFEALFGAERAAGLLDIEGDAKGAYGKPNAFTWMEWDDIRRVRNTLSLHERALLDALMTGIRSQDVRRLKIDQVHFHDGWCYILMPPGGDWDEPRTIPYHHGDETMGAHIRILRRLSPETKYLFPDPNDPTRPMSTKQLTSVVATWGRREGIRLTARRLRVTYLAYLLAKGCGEQYVAHVTGTRNMGPIYHLARQVRTAKLQQRDYGLPITAVPEVTAGHVPCVACGKDDNDQSDRVCGLCGHILGDAPLTTEAAVRARIMSQVAQLLDITGQTPAERARVAAAAARAGAGDQQ